MKIDRMLEIVFILMNQEKVSARNLSERFGVSVRTIQRDMESLSLAGVPVTSLGGREGGYTILPSFRIKHGEVKEEEQQLIVKALQSLATTYSSDTLRSVMEKYHALVEQKGQNKIYWDFGVTGGKPAGTGKERTAGNRDQRTKTGFIYLLQCKRCYLPSGRRAAGDSL